MIELSTQERADLIEAINAACDELCFDPNDSSKFPEAYEINRRWRLLEAKLLGSE